MKPNKFTFPFVLIACANLQSIPQAKHIHTHILKTGFQPNYIHTATSLSTTYLKLHLSEDALKLFDEIPNPTLPSFNAIISGLSQCGQFQESLCVFKRLNSQGLNPNSVTIASILPACRTPIQGSQLQGLAVKAGHESDVYVTTALVTMFSNCAQLGLAQKVFGLILDKTIVSYNAMISGCLRNGSPVMGLDLFREMASCLGERIGRSSLLSLLSVCSELSALILGKEVHCYSLKCEVSSDVIVGTAIVDMYSKCGSLKWAYQLFMKMGNRNVITWNSMISGFLSVGFLNKAVELFQQLRMEGVEPDSTTWNLMISGFSQQGNVVEAFKFFTMMRLEGVKYPSLKSMTSLLQACSSISDLRHGKEIHGHVIRTRAGVGDEFIETAMIHMYMACGCSLLARRIFDRVERESGDPALWNTMFSGYERNGEISPALEIFRRMQEQGVKSSSATSLVILSNIYARQGRWDDVERLRKMIIDKGFRKIPGCSWIEVKEFQYAGQQFAQA